jgi:hypothetical protein
MQSKKSFETFKFHNLTKKIFKLNIEQIAQ